MSNPTLQQTIERLAARLLQNSDDPTTIEHLSTVLSLRPLLPFEIDLWKAQNSYYRLRNSIVADLALRAASRDPEAQIRITALRSLGQKLQFRED